MAAIGSALQVVSVPSKGQDRAQGKSTFLTGSSAGIQGSVKALPVKAKRVAVIRATEGVQQQAQAVEGASAQVSAPVSNEACSPFATLSASVGTPPPPPAAPLNGTLVFGAGAAVAAGIAFLANKFAPALASAPATEVVIKATPSPPSTWKFNIPAYPPRSVTEAAPAALKSMAENFPNAKEDQAFVRACANELFNLGFRRDNSIALVNTCRDEVCRPLASFIDDQFGLSFNIAGLGGLINCGKTGFGAAFAHSPIFPCDVDGKPRERYVFFAFPHVSVGETGEVGSLLRRGRGKPSSACGALIAIKNDAKAGKLVSEDPDDPEYCLLKSKVLGSHTCQQCAPGSLDLVTVTNGALEVITEDLETLIQKTVNPDTADYAVITGVQIHSGNQVPGEPFRVDRTIDYVACATSYAVIRGKRYEMQVGKGSNGKVPATATTA